MSAERHNIRGNISAIPRRTSNQPNLWSLSSEEPRFPNLYVRPFILFLTLLSPFAKPHFKSNGVHLADKGLSLQYLVRETLVDELGYAF
jgi:hypothetical protein